MEKAIWGALCDADRRGIKGKEVTPFILSAVAHVTGGKSLEASILFAPIKMPPPLKELLFYITQARTKLLPFDVITKGTFFTLSPQHVT